MLCEMRHQSKRAGEKAENEALQGGIIATGDVVKQDIAKMILEKSQNETS